MNNVAAPQGVAYEAATIGGVPGVWCSPLQPRPQMSVLFLHGGGYVMAQAYRHFGGHFAQRLQAAVFVAD